MIPNKSYQLALRYLARRPKTIREMKAYLEKKKVSSSEIDQIIQRLTELGYLDDREFARQYIDNRIRFKPKSTYALGYELRQKGICPDIAEEVLSRLDNLELAVKAANLKAKLWEHLDAETRKKIDEPFKVQGIQPRGVHGGMGRADRP